MRARCSGEMPRPVSLTTSMPVSLSACARVAMVRRPPFAIASIALPARLISTWVS